MSITVAQERMPEKTTMRDVYAATLMELAEKDDRIVILDADLMNSIGTVPFAKKYPQRTFNCGIQEANMIGVAAGMSSTGLIPFTHTFGCFASRRAADQVFMSCAYAELNVKMIGSDPGITAAYNGGTHMALEDLAIMRSIPGITIVEPTDSVMLADLLRQAARTNGNFYIRLLRKLAVKIYKEGSSFELGKAVTLREGSDITIFASGICVADALTAADMLSVQGIQAQVINPFTIKPIDTDSITKAAKKTGAAVTVENHNIIGGLGSAVAEVLSENCPIPLERIGVHDTFGEVGPVDYLKKRFHMMPEDIMKTALQVIKRKN
ncbi:MAG: transketolase family protein [Enterocloster sp.]